MGNRISGSVPLALLAVIAACSSPRETRDLGAQPTSPKPNRTVVIIGREVTSLAGKPLQGRSGSAGSVVIPFNASLDRYDEQGEPVPLLAEQLPQLATDSWRVFPDGRMETTYRLKPNLTWQNGDPLTANDFVFSWRVYSTPDFGTSGAPISYMEDVRALDPRTLVIAWNQPYPDAAILGPAGFPPLPRTILGQSFEEMDPVQFAGLPFWVSEYVGLGPYKVDHLEAGSSIEASAFDGYVLGRPKIERMRLSFIQDPNTAIAWLQSGEGHFITDFIIGPDDARAIEELAGGQARGPAVDDAPTIARFTSFQFRSGYQDPALLGDPRVRKAIAYSIDNASALDAITFGKGKIVPVPLSAVEPTALAFQPALEKAIPTYGYDPQRAQQLLETAGLSRGSNGLFRAPDGSPFRFEFGFIQQASNARENAIFVDSLHRAGIDAFSRAYTQAELLTPGARALFPALFTGSGTTLTRLTSDEIPRPEKRWTGQNYGGWENPDYDRLKATFDVTLEPSERAEIILRMGQTYFDQLPGITHYLTPTVIAWSGDLTGVVPRAGHPTVTPLDYIYRWDWKP
ncbi:MAG TPA: ABC transporter substrate-binding protein [Chloroflexota bacterium]|nr:ABC transporter substrate-binding protein [Chloroflexota bacterium]